MNVRTLEFWQQVKKEWCPSLTRDSFCFTSDTFKEMWNDLGTTQQDYIVIDYAREFLPHYNNGHLISVGSIMLFKYMDDDIDLDVRKKFLDYMINKFSTNEME